MQTAVLCVYKGSLRAGVGEWKNNKYKKKSVVRPYYSA